MSLMKLPTVLKAFDLWINNESYAGSCTKVKLPDLKRKFEEMQSGGLTRAIQIDVGSDLMSLEFEMAGLDVSLLKDYASNSIDGVYLAFMGSLESDDAFTASALEVHVWGRYESLAFGEQAAGTLGATAATLNVDRIKIISNNNVLLEDDPRSMKMIVNGVDQYEKRRKALGRL